MFRLFTERARKRIVTYFDYQIARGKAIIGFHELRAFLPQKGEVATFLSSETETSLQLYSHWMTQIVIG
jgi:hypothetical protein